MRRGRKALAIGAASLAGLLALLFAALLFLESARFARLEKRTLEKRLSAMFQRPVTIDSLEIDPLTGSFAARSIEARSAEEPPDRPLLRIGMVRGGLRLRSLLIGKIILERLEVDSPELNLSRHEGKWSWSGRQAGAGRIEVRRVEVRRGLLRVADFDTPMDFVLEGARLEMGGEGPRRLAGNLDAERLILENPRLGRHLLGLSIGFELLPERIALSRIKIGGEWLDASASGEVRLDDEPAFTAQLSAHIDLKRLIFASGPSPVSGKLLYRGELALRRGGWKLDGMVRSPLLAWRGWTFRQVQGPVHGSEMTGMAFGPAKALLAGGKLEGTARLLPRSWGGKADFTAGGCDLGSVLEALRHPLPLAGRLEARGSVSWPAFRPDQADGKVAVSVALPSGPAPPGQWPVEGEAALTLAGGRILFERSEARSSEASLVARGEIDPRRERSSVAFSLSSRDLAKSAPLIEACSRAVGLEPSGWRLNTAAGAAIVSGTANCSERLWTGEGTFAASLLIYRGVNWGEAVGAFRLQPDALRLAGVRARREDRAASAEMSFQRGGEGVSMSGEVVSWDAPDLLGLAGLQLGIEGRLSGTFSIRRDQAGWSTTARAMMGPGKVRGFDVEGGSVDLSYERDLVRLSPLRLRIGGGTLEVKGDLAPNSGRAEALVSWDGVDLARLAALGGSGALSGMTKGEGRIVSEAGTFRFAGELSCPDLAARGAPLGHAAGTLETDFRSASLSIQLPDVSSRIDGRVGLAAPREVEAAIVLDGASIEALAATARVPPQEGLAGRVTAHLAVRGPLDEPGKLQVTGEADGLELFLGSARFVLEKPARIDFARGRMTLNEAVLESEGSRLSVSGWVEPGEPARLDLRGEGQVDLGVFQGFLPEASIRGTMNLRLEAVGTLPQPKLVGDITIARARLRRFDLPLVAENLQLAAHLSGQALEVPEFTADVGGGTVKGSASITLEGFKPGEVQVRLRGTNVTAAAPEGFRGTYSGSLELSGAGKRFRLKGDVEIEKGLYRKDFHLESFSLASRAREYPPRASSEESLANFVSLDIGLHASRDLWLKNDLGQVETNADLEIGGTVARPELTGRIVALEGGRIRFRRVDYRVDEAVVELNEPRRFNPYINLSAETRISDYDVVMHVFGAMDRLEYNLTSNPPLPPDQIVSLLITGSAAPLSTAPGQAPTDIARLYLGGTVTGIVEEPVEKLFHLSSFRIDPLLLAGEADPTTRITVGERPERYPDLLLLYSRDIGGVSGQVYALEYEISRHLRAFAERASTGGVGGDLRYRTRFRIGSKGSPSGASPGGAPNPPTLVGSISFEGEGKGETDSLRRRVKLRNGQPFSARKMQEGSAEIKRFYLDKGYLEDSVRALPQEQGKTVDVRYAIDRGRRIDVRIVGAGGEEKKIRARLEELWQGALFTMDLVEEARSEIAKYYREIGHYTVVVDRTSETLEDGTMRVSFQIDPGETVLIEEVTIQGNKELPDERIRRQMLTRPSALFSRNPLKPDVLEEDVGSIRSLYLEQGFLGARVEPHITLSPDGKVARVVISIEERERSKVGSVTFQPRTEGVAEKELAKLVPLRRGSPYGPDLASGGENALRLFYDAHGYPDVVVTTEAKRDGQTVDVTYQIEPGQKQSIQRIDIEGNQRTAAKVISRELHMTPGDAVSREQMREAQQRLYRLGIFEGVTIDTAPAAGASERVLRVRVRETENLTAGVGVGYDSESGPRGTVELADANFWGRARYVGVQARASAKDDRLQTVWKEPRLSGRNWDSTWSSFWERVERESFDFRRIGTSFLVNLKHSSTLTTLLRYNFNVSNVFNVSTLDSNVLSELQTETGQKLEPGRTRLASAGVGVVRDTRDSPFSPQRGTYLSADVRTFVPAVGSQKSFVKMFFQGTYQRQLAPSLVFATSARLGIAPTFAGTASVPLVERFFGGGDNTVRGFPRDLLGSNADRDSDGTTDNPGGTLVRQSPGGLKPLGGEALLIFNQELRFPIRHWLGGVVFYDAGNVYLRPSDLSFSDLRHTIGSGLRLETPVGPIRLEYGHKLDRQRGEGRGQFYISIGPAF